MAVTDYLPGLINSVENITRNLQTLKAMDMSREQMVFDYAINKAQLKAQQRRYLGEKAFREKEAEWSRSMSERRIALEEERAAQDKEYRDLQMELLGFQVEHKEEIYKEEKKNRDLERKVRLGQLSAQEFDLKLKKKYDRQRDEQLNSMRAMAEISNRAFEESMRLDERKTKMLADVQKATIYEQEKPSWLTQGLNYAAQLASWAAEGFGGVEFEAEKRMEKARQKRTVVKTAKDYPWLLFYDKSLESKKKMLDIIDNTAQKYNLSTYDKAGIYQSMSQQFPMIFSTPSPEMMKEDTMLSWLVNAGVDEEIISKYNLKDLKKDKMLQDIFEKHWKDVNSIQFNLQNQ